MEEIDLTDGQFQILLNMTNVPAEYDAPVTALVATLHNARHSGHKWYTKMSEQDIKVALDLFIAHRDNVRTSAAQRAVQFFAGGSATARRLSHERMREANVPRETSEAADE